MSKAKNVYPGPEHRKYIRLDSVFPVQFRLVSLDGRQLLSDWQQGFTSNVSKGGICLGVNNLKAELAEQIKEKQVKISLKIEMPLAANPVSALARIAWSAQASSQAQRYLIGLSYEKIDVPGNMRIMRYAWTKKIFFPAALTTIIILVIGFSLGSYLNLKLIKGSKALLHQLVLIIQESSVAKQQIKIITREKEELELKIHALKLRLEGMDKEGLACRGDASCLAGVNDLISKIIREKSILQERLIAVQQQENIITENLLRLDKRKADLQKANLDKLYQKLIRQQNAHTGLVAASESENQSLTMEQALVADAFANFSDFPAAKRIWDFFSQKAKRENGFFFSVYFADTGKPAHNAVSFTTNIWLGKAVLNYSLKTEDYSYLQLVEDIAQAIIALPDERRRYVVREDLDTYAFFSLLQKITNKPEYFLARDKAFKLLVDSGGGILMPLHAQIHAILVLGPEGLARLNINPDRVLETAGPESTTDKHIHMQRVAERVLAFKKMANFYYPKGMVAKARGYEFKADEYLARLTESVFSGKDFPMLSLSDIAYILFAHYNYNVFETNEK